MKFKDRFLRFAIGIFIGIVLSYMLFNNRGCNSFLPDSVIRERVQTSPLIFDQKVDCRLDCYQKPKTLIKAIVDSGEVVFSESQVHIVPKTYRFELRDIWAADFTMKDSAVVVSDFFNLEQAKNCECP